MSSLPSRYEEAKDWLEWQHALAKGQGECGVAALIELLQEKLFRLDSLED
jgi:hypothetical protein